MFAWNRDKNDKKDRVWHEFSAPDENGVIIKYEIKDLLASKLQEGIDLMKKYFIGDEPLCRITKLADDPLSVSHYEELWTESFKQGVALACFKSNVDELVGVNFLAVLSNNDPPCTREWPGRAFRFIEIKMTNGMIDTFDLFKTFEIERFLVGWGLAVSEKYRRRGIATEFMKSRIPVMEAFDIPYTGTVYSAVGSQKAAEKAGYQTFLETE